MTACTHCATCVRVCLLSGGGAVASTNGGANLQVFDSQFGNNSAAVSGGALSVSCSCFSCCPDPKSAVMVYTRAEQAMAAGAGPAPAATFARQGVLISRCSALHVCDCWERQISSVTSDVQAVGSCGTALATTQFADNTAGSGGAVFLGNYGRLGACSKGSCRCPPESRQSPALDQVPAAHAPALCAVLNCMQREHCRAAC